MYDVHIELQYFEGCPSWRTALDNLEAALRELGLPADVDLVRVESHEDAERRRFSGSPSLKVDGKDLFPAPALSCLGCRIYRTPEGLRGAPTRKMISEALEAERSGGSLLPATGSGR